MLGGSKLRWAKGSKRRSITIEIAVCAWAVGVFIWYFACFYPAISPILTRVLSYVWH